MKRISIFLLGSILLILLVGCTRTESDLESSKWDLAVLYEGSNIPVFDIEEAGYHVTSAVKFENATAYGLNEKEYRELTKEKIKEDFNGVLRVDFVPGKIVISFSKGEERRITQLFQQASFLNITSNVMLEKKFYYEGTDYDFAEVERNWKDIDNAMMETYHTQSKGVSFTDDDQMIGMTPSGDYKYSAIIFLPQVITLNGSYFINNKEVVVKYQYPLTSEDGYLDGIFFLAESDDEQSLPD